MNRTVLALTLLALPALASSEYPVTIQTKYGLEKEPPQSCSLCHVNGITGIGTVNTKFGKALRARGLTSGDEVSLEEALDQLEADMVDSDGDGTIDVDELKEGTNPSGGGPVLKYGCGASSVPVLLAAMGLLPLLRRRRQR